MTISRQSSSACEALPIFDSSSIDSDSKTNNSNGHQDNTQPILEHIKSPKDLRSLDLRQLICLATEVREELIRSVGVSGGHFASSLGVVELTIALHCAFNTPHDKLVWDVGHQCYIHKMLTDRKEQLDTIRSMGGISGFLSRSESSYDTFGAGHAGTSISAALGMSEALHRSGSDAKAIAIIGDGSLTAGMAFEALNHAGALRRNLIVVLNDNEMSISPNVGSISKRFSKAMTSKYSLRVRNHFKSLYQRGYIPEVVYKLLDRAEEAVQTFFASPAMMFEAFGMRYIGPIDGHNLQDTLEALELARDQEGPTVVHVHTIKGKGYAPAEADPVYWHGVKPHQVLSHKEMLRTQESSNHASSSNASPGESHKCIDKAIADFTEPNSFTGAFAQSLCELRQNDSKVVAVTAAMEGGTGLDKVKELFPDSVYDVGICEQHGVTFAAGLATEGMKPIVAIYSTFLQRAYDQVVHDVCIQKLPVVFAMDRSGVVGNDGHTHQGVFDIAYLRTLPNLQILAPRDYNQLHIALKYALDSDGPVAIRYPRGGVSKQCSELEEQPTCFDNISADYKALRPKLLRAGQDVLILALGPMAAIAEQVAQRAEKELGLSVAVLDPRCIKPLPGAELVEFCSAFKQVISLEDHAVAGGFGSAILEEFSNQQAQLRSPLKLFGAQDFFTPHASQAQQYAMHGYDCESVLKYLGSLRS